MELAAIIGTLFIAVVLFLLVYWTYRPPKRPDSDSDPTPPWDFIVAPLSDFELDLEDKRNRAGGCRID